MGIRTTYTLLTVSTRQQVEHIIIKRHIKRYHIDFTLEHRGFIAREPTNASVWRSQKIDCQSWRSLGASDPLAQVGSATLHPATQGAETSCDVAASGEQVRSLQLSAALALVLTVEAEVGWAVLQQPR